MKQAVTDGFYVLAWPEVENLCRLFGVDLEKMDADRAGIVGVELRMTDIDVAPVLTTVTDTILGRDYAHHPHPGHCFDLYKTSEFKAFCRRLGIPWELHTKAITVRIFQDEQPTTTQVYAMCENGQYPPDPDCLAVPDAEFGEPRMKRVVEKLIDLRRITDASKEAYFEASSVNPDAVIDTTSLHNREYRTKSPGGDNG